MKKQSSIEWYSRETTILNDYYGVRSITYEEYKEQKYKILNQAKEMHKQEIEHAHLHNRCSGDQSSKCFIEALENAENYYKQTFKSE